MELRWTAEAADDLAQIANYLFEQTPDRAADLVRQIYEFPSRLTRFPWSGRPGRKDGTRELVLPHLPYIVVYSIEAEAVRILRILHGARQWP